MLARVTKVELKLPFEVKLMYPVSHGPTAAIPVENPYCGCKLTRPLPPRSKDADFGEMCLVRHSKR